MKILVAYASKHGSTRDIAMTLAAELRQIGHDTVVREARELGTIAGYDAIILGSAIYMGRWLPEARQLVEKHLTELQKVPVWLFSSGPLGARETKAPIDSREVDRFINSTRAREHRVFAGRLDPDELGRLERFVFRAVHAPKGDFRDWEAIRNWAREISAAIGEFGPVGLRREAADQPTR